MRAAPRCRKHRTELSTPDRRAKRRISELNANRPITTTVTAKKTPRTGPGEPAGDADAKVKEVSTDYVQAQRSLRRCCGRTAIIAQTHPIKNAGRENLIPCGGGGGYLNEVDGNQHQGFAARCQAHKTITAPTSAEPREWRVLRD